MQQNATPCNNGSFQENEENRKLLQFRDLTVQQNRAIELLLQGQSDAEVAEALNVARTTVYRWRLTQPDFRSALHASQRAVQQPAANRVRSMVNAALDIIQSQLHDPNHALAAATALLRFAKLKIEPPAPQESDLTDILDAAFARPVEAE